MADDSLQCCLYKVYAGYIAELDSLVNQGFYCWYTFRTRFRTWHRYRQTGLSVLRAACVICNIKLYTFSLFIIQVSLSTSEFTNVVDKKKHE